MLKSTMIHIRSAFERADAGIKLHHYRIREFEPNVEMDFQRGHFLVKTVQSGRELEQCLRLRFSVFHKEYMNKRRDSGVDVDRLDYECDHLMILDSRTGSVIGTYRLNCSSFTNQIYSESEFHLAALKEFPGPRLELGRACIEKSYRNGVVIALLWRGIAEYMRLTQSQVLYGCSSVKTIDPMQIGMLTKYLIDQGHLTYDYGVRPTKKYRVAQLNHVLDYLARFPGEYKPEEARELIPPLLRSYIRIGAQVCGEPALDREFRCIDLLTLLKASQLEATTKERYGLGEPVKES